MYEQNDVRHKTEEYYRELDRKFERADTNRSMEEANAKLIADAAVLLEALKDVVDFFSAVPSCPCGDCDDVAERLVTARAAIKAATC